jgi:predicted Rossmann-fold nucleotide-binding protein
MKMRVSSAQKVAAWLQNPRPAVFQGQDLRSQSAAIASNSLTGCSFLGCAMDEVLTHAAAAAGCLLLPEPPGLPFDPFTPGLYTPDELYDQYDPGHPETYHACLDRRIYDSVMDADTKEPRPVEVDVFLMRRLHDASISEALDDLLDLPSRQRSVAIMGGHDIGRGQPVYAAIAALAQDLAREGYLVLTGGGPGLMEAGNLGAYTAGFASPAAVLRNALAELKAAPTFSHADWLAVGYRVWKAMGRPSAPQVSRNVGIPTWFYGHDPPNVFATDIAKYFENSVREEGLLAVADGGVVFAEGNAGTVQEIFQDACQNYYRTYDKCKSPMILFDADYWNHATPVSPLLQKLGVEKRFADYLLITDDISAIVPFLKSHPPAP